MDEVFMEKIPDNAEYIGDGVYVSFDGYQVIAMTPRVDSDNLGRLTEQSIHYIAFEPPVMEALIEYWRKTNRTS
jgi:hypothetical protein